MNGQPESRFHGKVRVQIGETIIEVNIFDDDREKLYLEIQQAIAQFSHDIKPAATAAQSESPRAGQARAAAAPSPVPKPTTTRTKAANPPVCGDCGLADMVELVEWVDKLTQEEKKAWKCQRCKTWLYPKQTQPVEELAY